MDDGMHAERKRLSFLKGRATALAALALALALSLTMAVAFRDITEIVELDLVESSRV